MELLKLIFDQAENQTMQQQIEQLQNNLRNIAKLEFMTTALLFILISIIFIGTFYELYKINRRLRKIEQIPLPFFSPPAENYQDENSLQEQKLIV